MITLEQILNIEGIVIRKIPKTTVHVWSAKEGEPNAFQDSNGNWRIKTEKENSLGGQYLVTIAGDQNRLVNFNKSNSGIAKTIPEAYADFLNKSSKDA